MKVKSPKNQVHEKSDALKAPKLFLLDVEGTIAPMSLVYEQLFPYARLHFERYLQSHSGEAGVVTI